MDKFKNVLNRANPNTLADVAREIKLGSLLSSVVAQCRVPVVGNIAQLPEGMRAAQVLSAYAVAGTVTGAFTGSASAAPATTQVGISVKGEVVFQATDAVTEAELVFVPLIGDLIEEEIFLNAAGLGTLGGGRQAKVLIEATVTTGASAGTKTPIARAGAPSAAQAAVTLLGTGIQFNAAAAAARATVKYIAMPKVGESSVELLNTETGVY